MSLYRRNVRFAGGAALLAGLCSAAIVGCGVAGGPNQFFGSPFVNNTGGGGTVNVPGGTGTISGGGLSGNDRTNTDPCTESQNRKFVRMSMRNTSDDFVHYFLVLFAFVNGPEYPTGSVCEDDIALYTSFGYQYYPAGTAPVEFGNYCIDPPVLIYFHRSGQFRSAGGSGGTGLASAIAPAAGSSATYDSFFSSAGQPVPVPDLIAFHNPGTGEGALLKISVNATNPCQAAVTLGDPNCQQDAFYYVDDQDRLTGSTALGTGSGRRIPAEIQGTGCQCNGVNQPFAILAPGGLSASGANCNEFFRGGRVDFAFLRNDTNPPVPQLVWRVTDATGGVAHAFDPRSGVP